MTEDGEVRIMKLQYYISAKDKYTPMIIGSQLLIMKEMSPQMNSSIRIS